MLPKKSALRKKERESEDPRICPKHLSYIKRTYVCAAFKSGDCEGPNDPHHPNLPALHLRTGEQLDAENHGTGRKVSDWEAVPLCRKHHDELHGINGGIVAFEAKHNLNLLAEGRKLVSPYKPRNWRELLEGDE